MLYVVALIIDPSLLEEKLTEIRVGDLIKDKYNSIEALDSEIVCEKGSDYTVNGAYKILVEGFVNVTLFDIYESIVKDKTAVEDIKKFALDRPLGDYLYDTLVQFVLKEKGKGVIRGYGYEAVVDGVYVLEYNFAEILTVAMNVNV